MQIDHSKLPRRYNPQYVLSQIARAVIAALFLLGFYLSGHVTATTATSPEVSYVVASTAAIAVIAFIVFAMRGRFDPTGIIYDLPEGQSPRARRLTLQKYTLTYLLISVVFAYLISLFVPECAFSKACIDFSEQSPFVVVARSVAPIVILLALGQSIGNFFGYALAWLRW